MKHFTQVAIFVSLLFFVPSFLFAATIVRSGENIALDAEQVVVGDFYAVGSTVTISGLIEGDLYAGGLTITVNGEVNDDAVLVGGSVRVHGPVHDDLRLVGGELEITGDVDGDVVVLGGTLKILSTSHIAGDVLFYGGDIDINGDVDGNISGMANSLRIDSAVKGDVLVTVNEKFSIGDKANLSGNLTYVSDEDLVRAQSAVVVGKIQRNEKTQSEIQPVSGPSVVPLLVLVFTSLVYLLLFKSHARGFINHLLISPGNKSLLGLALFILTPLVAVVLIASVLGALLGFGLLFLYLFLLLFSWSISGIVVGAFIAKLFTKKYAVNLMWTVIGTISMGLLLVTPVIGPLVALIIVIAIFGGIATLLYQKATK